MENNFKEYGAFYTQNICNVFDAIDPEYVDRFLNNLLDFKRIFLAERGRTGLILQTFEMRLVHLGKCANMIGLPITPRITKDDCLLVASGSGNTDGLILIAEKAKREGVYLFVISSQKKAVLPEMADNVLILQTYLGKEESDQENKVVQGTLFEQSLFITLDSMVGVIKDIEGQTFDDLSNRHVFLE